MLFMSSTPVEHRHPQVRNWIVPLNRKYPLAELLGTLREAFPTGKLKGDNFVIFGGCPSPYKIRNLDSEHAAAGYLVTSST